MKKSDNSRKYLISAIVWTVIALVVLAFFIFTGNPNTVGIISGVVLVAFCLAGQWLRYFRFR